MKIKYLGPFDEVEIPGVADPVKRNGTVEVPDELAGREPERDDEGNVVNPGAGLLAQVDAWVPVTTKKKAGS